LRKENKGRKVKTFRETNRRRDIRPGEILRRGVKRVRDVVKPSKKKEKKKLSYDL